MSSIGRFLALAMIVGSPVPQSRADSQMLEASLSQALARSLPSPASQPRPAPEPPGAEFALRATELAEAGWRLADIHIDEPRHWSDDSLELSLVFAVDEDARSLSLSFVRGGELVRSFADIARRAPKEQHVYRNEHQIVRALASGPVRSLSYECAYYFMAVDRGDGTETGADIDPLDYHVVKRKVTGQEAASALARELRAHPGAALIDVRSAREPRPDELRAVEFVWSYKERAYEAILRAGIDEKGRVLSVEVQRGPYREVMQRLTEQAQANLMASIATQPRIAALTAPTLSRRWSSEWDDDILPLTLRFGDKSHYVIRDRHFGPGDSQCGC